MTNTTQGKIIIGSDVGKKVNCSVCKKEGTTDQFVTLQNHDGSNVYLCANCKEETNKAFDNETKNPNIPFAIGAGIIGAILGGIVWYLIALSTGMEIGYISLGLGYLVGFGVYFGAGKKRGHQLQIISAIIALVAIFITERFIFNHALNEYIQSHLSMFPNVLPGDTVSLPLFDATFLESLVTPIGLLIYALGIYFAYKFCKPRKI